MIALVLLGVSNLGVPRINGFIPSLSVIVWGGHPISFSIPNLLLYENGV